MDGTARIQHDMPFGAVPVAGGVRFRLWAPAAKSVAVVLVDAGGNRDIPMHARQGGWYELHTPQAAAGSRYRFLIDGSMQVPDPAARAMDDAAQACIVVDPLAASWRHGAWRGRPWHEAVIYELHIGSFTPEGSFAALASRLDHLVDLGVTMVELMPVADFPGARGWSYDGVLPFAPDAAYGTPAQLKAFVDAAHARGLGVLLDVVYNHFGPEGNYLSMYAPQFFTSHHATPWGDAVNLDDAHSQTVRDFFIHNALYWIEEFQLDGLRIDAVHELFDDSPIHFIHELAARVRAGPGRERHVHLVLENAANAARLLGPPGHADSADAQWNDDFHHCMHVLLTGESDGYYRDYAGREHALLARCLATGFAYQGENSLHQGNRPRGEPSAHLPPTAFVNFLQNHDQIGNRAFGERLCRLTRDEPALIAATTILLLAPAPPMLFMGEEWAAPEPFTYFCDFGPALAHAVREGRKREFAAFGKFSDPKVAAAIPDPTDPCTFDAVVLDWQRRMQPGHAAWLARHRSLLALRHQHIVPLLPRLGPGCDCSPAGSTVVETQWRATTGEVLRLTANLAPQPVVHPAHAAQLLHATHPQGPVQGVERLLEAWSVRVELAEAT